MGAPSQAVVDGDVVPADEVWLIEACGVFTNDGGQNEWMMQIKKLNPDGTGFWLFPLHRNNGTAGGTPVLAVPRRFVLPPGTCVSGRCNGLAGDRKMGINYLGWSFPISYAKQRSPRPCLSDHLAGDLPHLIHPVARASEGLRSFLIFQVSVQGGKILLPSCFPHSPGSVYETYRFLDFIHYGLQSFVCGDCEKPGEDWREAANLVPGHPLPNRKNYLPFFSLKAKQPIQFRLCPMLCEKGLA
jgi:hypothetical protein